MANGVQGRAYDLVTMLVTVYGKVNSSLNALDGFVVNDATKTAVAELKSVIAKSVSLGLSADKLMIDFSVVNDAKYYNGIAFKGFIEGVPTGVLSGGQYDNLMKKMNKRYGAIGFAVYLDEVSRVKGE